MNYRPERSWKPWFDQRVMATHEKRGKPNSVGFQQPDKAND